MSIRHNDSKYTKIRDEIIMEDSNVGYNFILIRLSICNIVETKTT